MRRLALRDRFEGMGYAAAAAILLIVVFAIGLPMCGSYYERHTVTTHVVSKENVCSGSGDSVSCNYLIFTDAGTFKIDDAIFGVTRFNSSDVYGRVREDHDYVIKYYGWRIPVFSTYPNIESITPVEG